MPLPAGYGFPITAPDSFALVARSTGTYTSEPIFDPHGDFSLVRGVQLLVYTSEISGSPTLGCALESSPDQVTWTLIAGSDMAPMSDVGNASVNVAVSGSDYIRVVSTVGGTGTPSITYRAVALLIVPNDS
jgi:hypothetical protein